jgi:hypothetical protein
MARPKHADTRYLELKNGKYRVTVAVPRALQGKLGTKLKRPLNTDSRATANTLKWAVVAELKAIIDREGRGVAQGDHLTPRRWSLPPIGSPSGTIKSLPSLMRR